MKIKEEQVKMYVSYTKKKKPILGDELFKL